MCLIKKSDRIKNTPMPHHTLLMISKIMSLLTFGTLGGIVSLLFKLTVKQDQSLIHSPQQQQQQQQTWE